MKLHQLPNKITSIIHETLVLPITLQHPSVQKVSSFCLRFLPTFFPRISHKPQAILRTKPASRIRRGQRISIFLDLVLATRIRRVGGGGLAAARSRDPKSVFCIRNPIRTIRTSRSGNREKKTVFGN